MIRALGIGAFVLVVIRRDVYFAADYWLNAMGGRFVEEIGGGKKIAVVRDGDCGHFLTRRLSRQLSNFAGTIQERIIRVQM